MTMRNWSVAGLLAGAGVALWLLLAGPATVLGFDPGNVGMVLLMATAWGALYALARAPRGDDAMSPGEWKAWLGVAFLLAASAYFLAHADAFAGGGPFDNPHAARVARNMVLMLVAWAVLSSVVGARWRGRVEEDERDREIAVRAAGWGRGALVASIVGIALMLGFSPADRLQWATPFMVANLLVFGLMWGCLAEYAAAGILYWRDRR